MSSFLAAGPDPTPAYVDQRAASVLAERPLVVLTGAGVSTDSGIPD